MFATIQTNSATHILIHIPHFGSEKSLPALAAMLEKNATFIRAGYSNTEIVKPTMGIVLGDSHCVEYGEEEMIVTTSSEVLSEDFVIAAPDVFISNAKAMKKKDDEISKNRNEITYLKQQLESLKAQLEDLSNAQ